MNKLVLEKLKDEKEEYDKQIRNLDYKIVETSVEIQTKINMQKNTENNDTTKIDYLNNDLEKYRDEESKLTNEFFNKISSIKTSLREILDKKLEENPKEKSIYLFSICTLNRINDVYFDPEELINLSYIIVDGGSDEKDEVAKVQINDNRPVLASVTVEKPFEVEQRVKQPIQRFDIEEQRVVDFDNLINHLTKISRDYRTDIEKALSRFIINYNIVKNTQYLKNDFDNITNNYLSIFRSIIEKFKKDESIDLLQNRIKEQQNITQNLQEQIKLNDVQLKEMQRKMQELAKVYFAGTYAKKILEHVAELQGEQEVKAKNQIPRNENNEIEGVFQKIKNNTYNKRMSHIIEVSKWTKNIEEKIAIFHLEESDFQFIIYIIRQTENVCNANFEQVANIIIALCDINIQLEVVEKNEKETNLKFQSETNLTQVIREGIDVIKKKYSKMPFIGRKVNSILSAKLLN